MCPCHLCQMDDAESYLATESRRGRQRLCTGGGPGVSAWSQVSTARGVTARSGGRDRGRGTGAGGPGRRGRSGRRDWASTAKFRGRRRVTGPSRLSRRLTAFRQARARPSGQTATRPGNEHTPMPASFEDQLIEQANIVINIQSIKDQG